ncbi:tetratricopeptide repeat protein [Spirosoma montaniterrae]|uniref:Oxygen sensor histidine kinase NreB n=1 Tax=Spirosoma montaniterrae TaxID=1178516 RepID=A0A1P9WZQ8_9BACT|nr:tetratricopeptide repeat protein [Spirosoma montaniterrae]AQG80877.1 hypothetical protein AWR27_17055 [Spirosoma montaniterrae]
MKSIKLLLWLVYCMSLTLPLWAQQYDTPPFNFDRSLDQRYVDSLVQATRTRLLALNRLRPSAMVDTARMEFMHYIAYVHYSGMTHRDSALVIASQLVRLAERHQNTKFQIKGLLLIERYYRGFRLDYPKAIGINYKVLALAETTPELKNYYFWRLYRNLGTISTAIGEYDEAISYLQKAITGFQHDAKSDRIHLADLHKCLADAYKEKRQFDRAETHYLTAWQIVEQMKASLSSKGYLTNDIGSLYNSLNKPAQALPYLRRSVQYWAQLNAPLPQSDALADLANTYLMMNEYDNAINAAKEALTKNQTVLVTRQMAYSVLVRAYERQQDWKNAFAYQQLYNETKQQRQEAVNQTESLRIKARYERERLETTHRQEQLMQQQRYQTLAKQAEIDRLNSMVQANELRRTAQTNALKHQLETQQLKAQSAQKQSVQQSTIRQLKINQLRLGLQAQERQKKQLFAGLAIISLLGLLLLYYSLRLRRSNLALRIKNREIEQALLRGQTIERRRVASELHDQVSSLLGATKMTFQTIDADTLPPREKKLYENSLNLLNDAVARVRQLSHNLIPEQLLQQNLATSLKSLLKQMNTAGKTRFSLTCDLADVRPLLPEVTFHLYVICLELCTNVLRHADATHANLHLSGQNGWLTLQLNDNGIGLNPDADAGMGLQSIRDRAKAIGGQFWLEAGESGGTQATISLPVEQPVLT